jgi:hypothetical protein
MANMKHNKSSRHQNQAPASASPPTTAVDLDQSGNVFVPSPDEVARRAYLNYVNQGAQPGHDVQHWLAAEAQLIAERSLTRVHGFHNRT